MSPSPDMNRQDGRPAPPAARPPTSTGEFSLEERGLLLQLARESIAYAFEHRDVPTASPSAHLAQPRGTFTTIYVRDQLHGCVGYVVPVASLYRTVAETARAAAFDDPRFAPLTREEFTHLTVSISILSAPALVYPEQVEIGRHGLIITQGAHRGLLLPQVPVEHGWDRVTFLEQVCRKAGLSSDAWKGGTKLEAFTAEVFREGEVA